MKLLAEYLDNAFHRRIARDYQKMPAAMKGSFLLNHYIRKNSEWVSLLLLLMALASMIMVTLGTWLTGGAGLISQSLWFVPMLSISASAIAVKWVIPTVSNFVFTYWYYSSRTKF